jgi:hypothetical protein
MRPLRVVLLVFGIFVAIIAIGLLAGGGALVWAHTTQRDADGYYSTDAERLTSPSYALTSDALDLGTHPGAWVPTDVATLRIASNDPTNLFIGVAPTARVERYLRGVPHTVVTDIQSDPFHATTREAGGNDAPEPPDQQDFWAATARDGELTWSVASGNWTVVVMNRDASQGVDANLAVGVKTALLLPIGIVLLVVGLLLAAGAIAMIIASTRGRRRDENRLPPGAMPARPDDPSGLPTPARPDDTQG